MNKTEARRVWQACYHTRCSGVIYTGALQNTTGLWFALEAEYLPKGRLNGYSLDLNARLQSVFSSVFGCHGYCCLLVRWDQNFDCGMARETCCQINILSVRILMGWWIVSVEASDARVRRSSIGPS